MAEPANPRRLTLAEAEAFVADLRQIDRDEARRILLALLQTDEIAARGRIPQNALSDPDFAWRHAKVTRVEEISSEWWFFAVDWTRGRVERYREITIPEPKLMGLFRASRGPGTRAALDAVRKAVEAYAALERKNQRPLYESRCFDHVKKLLPNATRAQIMQVYRSVEGTPKPRGRPRKENPPE